MVVEITSNGDLPECLNTLSKQTFKAHQLAYQRSGIPAYKSQGPRPEGFFSRTRIVTLQNGEKLVIQFRPEPLDIRPYQLARGALGTKVPDITRLDDQELESSGIWAYCMTYIPGKTWLYGMRGKDSRARITTNRSLGRILSKGHIHGSTEPTITEQVRPHLALILSSQDDQIRPFHPVARTLFDDLDQLRNLPLFISHYDLNEVNILVDDDCEVAGIVDWELSIPLPLGMGCSRIHTLAGEFSEQKFYMPPEFEEAERGFWQEIYCGVSEDIRMIFDATPGAILFAVILGTLLDAFQLVEGKLGPYNPVVVAALPKLLTYRFPFARGTDPPYSE